MVTVVPALFVIHYTEKCETADQEQHISYQPVDFRCYSCAYQTYCKGSINHHVFMRCEHRCQLHCHTVIEFNHRSG